MGGHESGDLEYDKNNWVMALIAVRTTMGTAVHNAAEEVRLDENIKEIRSKKKEIKYLTVGDKTTRTRER